MEQEYFFKWLHISDIHFGQPAAPDRFDQRLVLDVLAKDISAYVKNYSFTPDAVFVTGDIAYHGDREEYGEAHTYLIRLAEFINVERQQIFFVPGNHDIQRNLEKQNRNVTRLLDALRRGEDTIDNVVTNSSDRILLEGRLENYGEFLVNFDPGSTRRLFWTKRSSLRGGVAIRLVGFNTAFLSGSPQDFENLQLGKWQLAEAFSSIDKNELVVVLSHHPFSWLRDYKSAAEWTNKYAHVHLFGHMHEAYSNRLQAGGGNEIVQISAGAAHYAATPNETRYGFSWGAIRHRGKGRLVLQVWPHVWSSKNKCFHPDTDNIPEGRTFAEYELKHLDLPENEKMSYWNDLLKIKISISMFQN